MIENRWFALLAVVIVASGCNLIMDLGRFNETSAEQDGGGDSGASDTGVPDTGSADAGPDADPRFACLALPGESLDPSQVTLELLVADATKTAQTPASVDGGTDLTYVVYTPRAGVSMSACLGFDPACANPVTTPALTNDAGSVSFTLSGNFVGFFHGTAPGIVPFSLFPGQWPTGEKHEQYGTSSLSVSDETLLNAALNNAVDLDAGSGLGEVFVIVYDCFEHRLAGATVALSKSAPNTLPFYVTSSGVPDTTAQVTDNAGVGGAVNVPAGTVKVTATFLATSTTIGSIDVYVRPAELTYAWIRPRVH